MTSMFFWVPLSGEQIVSDFIATVSFAFFACVAIKCAS